MEIGGQIMAGRCIVPVAVMPVGIPQQCMMLAGLVDTGASRSSITVQMASQIGLQSIGRSLVMGSGGAGNAEDFEAQIEIWSQGAQASAAFLDPRFNLATLLSPVVGMHFLLGMDILSRTDFCINPEGKWSITRMLGLTEL